MSKISVQLLQPHERRKLDEFLRLYARSFNPDERVSPHVLRRVAAPSPARVNPVHLWGAFREDRLVGGVCNLVLPAFSVVFGSYIFVHPEMRGRGLGKRLMRSALNLERRGPHGLNWRYYVEVTAASGDPWHATLGVAGFRFFRAPWPIVSYQQPGKIVNGRLGYFAFRKTPPPRFSQPALLMYIHALFYGPDAAHRYLLPRLRNFVPLDA